MNREMTGRVAIIGMSCRFPGARGVSAFWENLKQGRESISFFDVQNKSGRNADFVPALGILDDPDLFDASLFGLSPHEAELMDPQQRIFLECAWEALEDAGYHYDGNDRSIGVFAGADTNNYLDFMKFGGLSPSDARDLRMGNHKDFFATRLSYLFNLTGPGITVQTASSTSLVAVHLACRSILGGECALALAGGCSIPAPIGNGYYYDEKSKYSPDGHCRAYDREASGTVPGSGAGIVVLKRLEEALADGDHIHAVVLGSAINNEGKSRTGFATPGSQGALEVMTAAMKAAKVKPDQITYLEGNGMGVPKADQMELAAAARAFGSSKGSRCALGSVKTNIGHSNAAAGIAGLIKSTLCLRYATLVPSLHFQEPGERLPLNGSPFYVNTQTKPWDEENRIAGINSFGTGGANAHVILGEAPQPTEYEERDRIRPHRLLNLSARTETALAEMRRRLRTWLEEHPQADLGDVAFTQNVGRRGLDCRQYLVFSDREELLKGLESQEFFQSGAYEREVVFLFPGQGSFFEDLGSKLYREEPCFREVVHLCRDILEPHLGVDLAAMMFGEDLSAIRRTSLWQPALFVCEYALAVLWISWGIRPAALLGHSVGEYVAATLAGIFTLKDALVLVARRAALIEPINNGAMLVALATERDIAAFLEDGLWPAAVNGPRIHVISGGLEQINNLRTRLKDAGIHTISMTGSHAFHSPLMAPAAEALEELLAEVPMSPPEIPIISNLTGTWLTEVEAVDPRYWSRHLCRPVRFQQGLWTLFREPGRVFLELGPGRTLSNLVKRHPDNPSTSLATLERNGDLKAVLQALGRLWSLGARPDWEIFYGNRPRRRIPIPTYPFEGRSYWLGAGGQTQLEEPPIMETRRSISDWFYLTLWKQSPQLRPFRDNQISEGHIWLIFEDWLGFCDELSQRLECLGQTVFRVRRGREFQAGEKRFIVNPSDAESYLSLWMELQRRETLPSEIVHAWRLDETISGMGLKAQLACGFESILHLMRTMAGLEIQNRLRLTMITNNLFHIAGEQRSVPEKAALLGAGWVLPMEFPNITCKNIDMEQGSTRADQVLGELLTDDSVVAFRGGTRWLRIFKPIHLPPAEAQWKRHGVYLISNAFQSIGFMLAGQLAEKTDGHLILADPARCPPPEDWADWIEQHGENHIVSRWILEVQCIMDKGARVTVIQADTARKEACGALKSFLKRTNPDCVFHLDRLSTPGLTRGKSSRNLSGILEGKIREAMNLSAMAHNAKRIIFFSENPAEEGVGRIEQEAAYAFLARYADVLTCQGVPAMTLDWGTRSWIEEGECIPTTASLRRMEREKRRLYGMTRLECLEALNRVFSLAIPHVTISTRDFVAGMKQQAQFNTNWLMKQVGSVRRRGRRGLPNEYQAPGNPVEKAIAELWGRIFEIEEPGIHDNFFDLGGHSLLVVRLIEKLQARFSIDISVDLVFSAPTIAELALLIQGKGESEENKGLEALMEEIITGPEEPEREDAMYTAISVENLDG